MIYAAAAQVLRTNRPIYIIYLLLLLGWDWGLCVAAALVTASNQQQPARIKIKILGVRFN